MKRDLNEKEKKRLYTFLKKHKDPKNEGFLLNSYVIDDSLIYGNLILPSKISVEVMLIKQ